MNKRQLINAILQYNRSTTQRFLQQFDEADLSEYLQLLESASRRTRRSSPVRATTIRKVL